MKKKHVFGFLSFKYRIWVGIFYFFLSLMPLGHAQEAGKVHEDFKGTPSDASFSVGALMGLGILDPMAGFALLGTASKKIIHHGFVKDINNQVFIEAHAGPLFVSGSTAFVYSLHLRWDFPKDDQWTFYALGGLGGNITGSRLGDRWMLFPRFGVGSALKLQSQLMLRAELSHEFIGVGLTFFN